MSDPNEKIPSSLEEDLLKALEKGPMTRDDLAREMETPRTTLFDGLKKLIIKGDVKKYPHYTRDQGRGRPQVYFERTYK